MKTSSRGMRFLRDLEAVDQFQLNGRQYQVILFALSYAQRGKAWVYDFTAGKAILMNGKTQIPEDQIQFST
jgi:hypothetical protein